MSCIKYYYLYPVVLVPPVINSTLACFFFKILLLFLCVCVSCTGVRVLQRTVVWFLLELSVERTAHSCTGTVPVYHNSPNTGEAGMLGGPRTYTVAEIAARVCYSLIAWFLQCTQHRTHRQHARHPASSVPVLNPGTLPRLPSAPPLSLPHSQVCARRSHGA